MGDACAVRGYCLRLRAARFLFNRKQGCNAMNYEAIIFSATGEVIEETAADSENAAYEWLVERLESGSSCYGRIILDGETVREFGA